MKDSSSSPNQPLYENTSHSSLNSAVSPSMSTPVLPVAAGGMVPIQAGGTSMSTSNLGSVMGTAYTQEQLWELLKSKEALTHTLQQKLTHYRTWLSSIHARVQQMSPNVIKNARRLYVGGLDEGFEDEEMLKATLSDCMMSRGGCTSPGNPILSCKVTPEKGYAFIELRSVEEATNVLAFDGIAFQNTHLKIRRPSNYDPVAALMLGPANPDPTIDNSNLDICRNVVEDSPSKLFVGGLPCDWSEDQVKELLIPLGSLKAFNLVMDKVTGKSKGYAFCLFDEGATDYVIAALNQKKVGNKVLTVKRALEGTKPGGPNMLSANSSTSSQQLPTQTSGPVQQLQQSQSSNLMAGVFSGMSLEEGNMNNNGVMRSNELPPVRNHPQQRSHPHPQQNAVGSNMMLKQDVYMNGGMQKSMSGSHIANGADTNNINNNMMNPNMQYAMNGTPPPGARFGIGGASNGIW
eukprot:TRINITY_DN7514_c0_g1_i1.p2 TRINITY_DN7514_c0_g1~~TRINITY_DN7514_c0_g1_i1.p2  ORF type:complete len:462 (+),score=68.21 TRINITY_DN7514_c0_g1_i1:293-1678(+)